MWKKSQQDTIVSINRTPSPFFFQPSSLLLLLSNGRKPPPSTLPLAPAKESCGRKARRLNEIINI